MKPYQLGWFSTAKGQGSRDLLTTVEQSIQRGEIEAEIAFVFCSREPGEAPETDIFLKMVEEYRIPLVCYSYRKFKAERGISETAMPEALPSWRLDYDREAMKRLAKFNPDLCILAGYMLVVGKEICQKYDMINLHPAAPHGPKGTWREVIWQLIADNARQTGVMMHLVTPELDEGPPVTYCAFPIRGEPFDRHWAEISRQPVAQIKKSQGENNQLFQLIRQHGVKRELPLIVTTIRAFSQGKVRISKDKKVIDSQGQPIYGYDLTADIERELSQMR